MSLYFIWNLWPSVIFLFIIIILFAVATKFMHRNKWAILAWLAIVAAAYAAIAIYQVTNDNYGEMVISLIFFGFWIALISVGGFALPNNTVGVATSALSEETLPEAVEAGPNWAFPGSVELPIIETTKSRFWKFEDHLANDPHKAHRLPLTMTAEPGVLGYAEEVVVKYRLRAAEAPKLNRIDGGFDKVEEVMEEEIMDEYEEVFKIMTPKQIDGTDHMLAAQGGTANEKGKDFLERKLKETLQAHMDSANLDYPVDIEGVTIGATSLSDEYLAALSAGALMKLTQQAKDAEADALGKRIKKFAEENYAALYLTDPTKAMEQAKIAMGITPKTIKDDNLNITGTNPRNVKIMHTTGGRP